jgi:hypothetical protein
MSDHIPPHLLNQLTNLSSILSQISQAVPVPAHPPTLSQNTLQAPNPITNPPTYQAEQGSFDVNQPISLYTGRPSPAQSPHGPQPPPPSVFAGHPASVPQLQSTGYPNLSVHSNPTSAQSQAQDMSTAHRHASRN